MVRSTLLEPILVQMLINALVLELVDHLNDLVLVALGYVLAAVEVAAKGLVN